MKKLLQILLVVACATPSVVTYADNTTYTVEGNEFNLGTTTIGDNLTIPSSGSFAAGDIIETNCGVTLKFNTKNFGNSTSADENKLNSNYQKYSRGDSNASWTEGSSLSNCYYQFANPSSDTNTGSVYVVAYVRLGKNETLYLTDNSSHNAVYIDYYTFMSEVPRTTGSNGITNSGSNTSGAVIFKLEAGATRNLFVNGARMNFYGFEVKTDDNFILEDTNLGTESTSITGRISNLLNNTTETESQVIALGRTLQGSALNTICLPFDLSQSETKKYFGSDVEFYAPYNVDNSEFQFQQVTSAGMQAGLPYLVKPDYDIENPVFYVEITNAAADTLRFGNTDYYLQGVYEPTELKTDGTDLFLTSSGDSFTLYKPSSGTDYTAYTMKGFRAYFKAPSESAASEANGSSIFIIDTDEEEGGTTFISLAPVATEQQSYDGLMYNLHGMRVNDDYKGIVIINGKKVLKR